MKEFPRLVEVDEPLVYVHYEPGKFSVAIFRILGIIVLTVLLLTAALGFLIAFIVTFAP